MYIRHAIGLLGLTLMLAACGQQGAGLQEPQAALPGTHTRTQAPLLGTTNPEAIPGQYVVVFSEGASDNNLTAQDGGGLIRALGLDPQGITVQHLYTQALHGFAANLSAQNLARLQADPRVKYIEQDAVVHVDATQTGATWGLDRIDQRNLPLDGNYTYDSTASNVTAYIIDTGIRTTHADFGGRAVWGTNQSGDGNNSDCQGHGTHVAGTVGSSSYGVAKGVKLVAVKVLNCQGSGTNSGVIAGVNWAVSNKTGPAVANMSLGGGASQAVDDAVTGAVSKGLVMAVAAGNDNVDACTVSPARAASAITVGSTTNTDARSSFSNYGTCVDIFAPGSDITSTWHTGDTATNTISGTSMASPHVAGAAALILSANPSYTPAQVTNALINTTTPNKVTGPGAGSPNRLLYTLSGSTTPAPTPTPGTQTYQGTVFAGGFSYQPSTSGFTSAGGTLKATLTGPAGTDFDLYLMKKTSTGYWTYVAQSGGATSSESLTYSATSGTYLWAVYGYMGSGTYTLVETR